MDRERMEWMTPPQCKQDCVDTVSIGFVCVLLHGFLSRLSLIDRKSQFLQEDHARLGSLDVHESVARSQGKRCRLEFQPVADPSGSDSKLKISLMLIMLFTVCNLLKALLKVYPKNSFCRT